MLTMQDCLDYSDISEDEVKSIAHHEHISYEAAAHLACALTQDKAGEEVLRHMLEDVVCESADCGQKEALLLAERAYFHFATHHPQ